MKTEKILLITFIFLLLVNKVSAGITEEINTIINDSTVYEVDVYEALSYLKDSGKIKPYTFRALDYILGLTRDEWYEVTAIYDTYRNKGRTEEQAIDSVYWFYSLE